MLQTMEIDGSSCSRSVASVKSVTGGFPFLHTSVFLSILSDVKGKEEGQTKEHEIMHVM